MSWRKITFIVVALIILLGGSAALSKLFVSMKPEPPRKPEMELKRSVKAEAVKYSDVYSELLRTGRVSAGSEIPLVSEAAGKIEPGQVVLRNGSSFREGQLLAVIYKDEVELALKARKSRFLTVLSTMLPDLKVDFPDAYPAFMTFFNSIEMDKDLPVLPEPKDEKLKIFLASRNVISEYYGILQDEKKLSRHSLYAPFNGTFIQVNFEAGAFVNVGGQIARMVKTDQLEIEVPVENEQSKWIKIGDRVLVSESNSPGENEKEGVVIRKASVIDPSTQMRSLFVKVQNSANNELLAGELKWVTFPGQKIEAAMEIPRSAVFNSNEVFAVVDGKLKKRTLNIIKVNETTLIFNGLEEGEKIVVEPLINVKENSPVTIFGEKQPGKKQQGGQAAPESNEKQKA